MRCTWFSCSKHWESIPLFSYVYSRVWQRCILLWHAMFIFQLWLVMSGGSGKGAAGLHWKRSNSKFSRCGYPDKINAKNGCETWGVLSTLYSEEWIWKLVWVLVSTNCGFRGIKVVQSWYHSGAWWCVCCDCSSCGQSLMSAGGWAD